MKWLAILTLSTMASASPVRPRDGEVYTLKTTSTTMPELNGKQLAIKDGTVGVFGAGAQPAQFTVAPQNGGRTVVLHTHPTGFADHVLALRGDGGVRTLSDVLAADTAAPRPGSKKVDGTSFKMGATIRGISSGTLTYDGNGEWKAFPRGNGDWNVTWSDGDSFSITTDQRIEVTYEIAKGDTSSWSMSD